MRPRIELNVAELVLEELSPLDRELIGPAIEAELNRLFFLEGGRPWMGKLEQMAMPDCTIEIPPGCRPNQVAVHIARDLYRQLSTPQPPAAPERQGGRPWPNPRSRPPRRARQRSEIPR